MSWLNLCNNNVSVLMQWLPSFFGMWQNNHRPDERGMLGVQHPIHPRVNSVFGLLGQSLVKLCDFLFHFIFFACTGFKLSFDKIELCPGSVTNNLRDL